MGGGAGPAGPDFRAIRRAVALRDRCREAAVAAGVRLGVPLSGVQAQVAYDAMVDLIRDAARPSAETRGEGDAPCP